MKFVAGIILVVFVSFGQSVILNCEFRMADWSFFENIYQCYSLAENTGNSTIIEKVHGEHWSGKGNEDVEAFRENGTLTFIPTNLAIFFPNLKTIIFESPLLKLSSSDLKPFPDLLRFYSWNGKFTSIDGDLFQYTSKLKIIYFSVPELKNVGANFLNGLEDLSYVEFEDCECIETIDAYSSQQIQQLKQKLLLQCPPLEPLTSPLTTPRTTTTLPSTTTVSTSTSTEVKDQREKNSKVEETISEMTKVIANLEETNRKQEKTIAQHEDRLVEMEKLLREISARP
jgi:hypothetical protein